MYIRALTRRVWNSDALALHDALGNRVPPAKARAEFDAIRAHLLKHPGARICALNLSYDYRYLLATLACMDVGVAYLPLRVTWPKQRIEQIGRLSAWDLLLDDANIGAVCAAPAPRELKTPPVDPEQPLYIIYTSGSTGAPKGVVIQRKAYEHFLKWMDAELTFEQRCKLMFVVDFTSDISLQDVGLALLKEVDVYFSQFQSDYFRLAYEIETWEIESLTTVPNNINMLLQDDLFERANYQSLRRLYLGGSRFSYGTYRSIFTKLPQVKDVYNLYGPTEATIWCHYKRLVGDEARDVIDANVSIGVPIPGLTATLLDAQGAQVDGADATGELVVGGPQVMKEYLGDPERTAESLTRVDGDVYYRTGDLAFRARSGEYFLTGRKDDTLKRRGYRVNLLDIDSYLQKLPWVQDCATVAIADPETDNVLVTFVVPRNEIPEEELKRKMAEVLVEYQVPDHVLYTSHFPTNNAGKVCKATLRQWFATRAA